MHEQFSLDSTQAQQIATDVPPPEGLLTPEQIASRNQLVQLHREVEDTRAYKPTPFIDQLSALTPDEARELIQRERSHSEEIGRVSSNLQEYNEFVTDLRQVRAEQRDHIVGELQKIADDAPVEEKRAAYLDALEHSPPLATKAMEKINQLTQKVSFDGPRPKKVFSDEQIDEVAQNGEKFKQALTQLIIDEPALVFRTSTILEKVASPDEIKTALDTIRESDPKMLLGHIDIIMKFYQKDEARDLVLELAEAQPAHALYKILKPTILNLIGEQEVGRLAKKAVHEGVFLPSGYALQECIDKGFISKDEVKKRVFEEFDAQPSNVEIHTYTDGDDPILTPDDVQMLADSLYAKVQNEELGIFAIKLTRLLTPEQKQTLFQQRFNKEPTIMAAEYPDMVAQYVDPEIARDAVLQLIADPEQRAYDRPNMILRNSILTLEDKQTYARELATKDPNLFIINLEFVNGTIGDPLLSEQELSLIVQNAFTVDFENACVHLSDCAEYFPDPEQLKKIIQDGIAEHPTMQIFRESNRATLSKLFTQEEQQELFQSIISVKLEEVLSGEVSADKININGIINYFGDQAVKSVVDQLWTGKPEAVVSLLPSVSYLYNKDELTSMVLGIANTPAGGAFLMENLYWNSFDTANSWHKVVGRETMIQLVQSVSPEHYDSITMLRDRFVKIVGQEVASEIALKILNANPALAIADPQFFEMYVPGFEVNSVIETALSDELIMSIAGKYLSEILGRVQKTDRESVRERLLTEASQIYVMLEKQKQAGAIEGAAALRKKFDLNANAERNLFETYNTIVELGSAEQLETVSSSETTLEVEHIAVQAIAGSLGIEGEITPDQSAKLIEALGRSTPLGLYVTQYRQSAEHVAVLKPMTEALLSGDYESWKFGKPTAENLDTLKQLGLLPSNITEQQYAAWRITTSSERTEAFTVETNAVMSEVERILSDNELELPSGSMVEATERVEVLHSIADELSETGQNIGKLHQEIKMLRAQPDQEMTKTQIDELQSELAELEQVRTEIQIQQDVIQLLSLSEEEIRSGIMRTQGEGKGRPIVQALQRLRKNIRPEARFVSEQLDAVFDSFAAQTGESQTLQIQDTASAQITMEIGELPLASCQNYRNGIMNDSLIGYTDPNTKVLLLSNEKGNPVARSIFRILSDESGNPVLHAETIYTSDVSDGVARAIYQHALEKAKAIGVPLYISAESQNEEGHMVGVRQIDGITTEPLEASLSSQGSRAPLVYVDSAGGWQKSGKYTISNVSLVSSSS